MKCNIKGVIMSQMMKKTIYSMIFTIAFIVVAVNYVYAAEINDTVNKEQFVNDPDTKIKIDKDHFPGMYQLLLKGYYSYNQYGEKQYYDANKDGYLDQSEIQKIYSLTNANLKYTDTGYYSEYGYKKYQAKLTSFDGLEYLTNVSSIDISGCTMKMIDLSDNTFVKRIKISMPNVSTLCVNAPYIRSIIIQSDNYGSDKNVKLKSVDISKCTKIVEIDISGSYYKYIGIKMPKKAPDLLSSSISYVSNKTIDFNGYKNLRQVYFYACKAKTMKLNACNQLLFAYFYFSDNVSSVNLANAKSLIGSDIYYCKKLKSSNLKVRKGAKVTTNKGKWWYGTDPYNDLLNQVWDNVIS